MITTQTPLNQLLPPREAPGNSRPLLVVSGCLLGEPVRYDGGDKSLGSLRDLLQANLRLHSVCPEVYAGMGTPRPPVQWVATSGGDDLQRVEDPAISARELLLDGCQKWVDSWQGEAPVAALLKARSPSCGNGTTPLLDEAGELLRYRDGAFVETLKRRWPQLWIIDEESIDSKADVLWLCRLLQWRQFNHRAGESLLALLALEPAQRLAWWQQHGHQGKPDL